MFFKKQIKKCLQLENSLKVILPDKNLINFNPVCYFKINKLNSNENSLFVNNSKDIINQNIPNLVEDVKFLENTKQVNLILNQNQFLENTINNLKHGIDNYSEFFGHKIIKKNLVVDFSSPNIAKKLHFGNFRSTIIGHYLCNLNTYKGNSVIKINYLGDYGTQFGILSLSFDKFGSYEELKKNPIQHLLEVYVKGNQEIINDKEFEEKSRERFTILENQSDERIVKQWKLFRDISLKEYDKDYEKLGINFDFTHFESSYNEKAKTLFSNNETFSKLDDGSTFVEIGKKKETVLKKDGSTLYLSRDVCAAIDRKEKFNFDLCYYIVDISQRDHFKKLKNIIKLLKYDWFDQIVHIPFGRIKKMSTRKGNFTLLSDVLELSESIVVKTTQENKNTKITLEELKKTKFDLALACIVINIFKHKRTTDLDFDINYFTDQTKDSGTSLMYCYARLNNLKENCGIAFNLDCKLNYDALKGNESFYLLLLLSMYDETIEQSYNLLEPRILIDYLFLLKNAINRAYKAYPIKGQTESFGQTRLLLFHCAELILEKSFKLCGITPLKKI